MSKIYSLSLEKGVVRILANFFKQRFYKIITKIMIHGQHALHDHIKWSVYMNIGVHKFNNFLSSQNFISRCFDGMTAFFFKVDAF